MLCLLWSVLPFYAAQVDTLMVKSPSMNKEVQVVVVVPDIALGKKGVDCPVIYLLHGFGGNAKTWIGIRPELPQIADEKGMKLAVIGGKAIPMVKTVGIGIARRIRIIATRLLSLQK